GYSPRDVTFRSSRRACRLCDHAPASRACQSGADSAVKRTDLPPAVEMLCIPQRKLPADQRVRRSPTSERDYAIVAALRYVRFRPATRLLFQFQDLRLVLSNAIRRGTAA